MSAKNTSEFMRSMDDDEWLTRRSLPSELGRIVFDLAPVVFLKAMFKPVYLYLPGKFRRVFGFIMNFL